MKLLHGAKMLFKIVIANIKKCFLQILSEKSIVAFERKWTSAKIFQNKDTEFLPSSTVVSGI